MNRVVVISRIEGKPRCSVDLWRSGNTNFWEYKLHRVKRQRRALHKSEYVRTLRAGGWWGKTSTTWTFDLLTVVEKEVRLVTITEQSHFYPASERATCRCGS